MLYRSNPRNGDSISQLGLGCMRFPRSVGRIIDQQKTNDLIAAAIDHGINYFDTAYVYPGSEAALGKALTAIGKRDQVFIGTKLPHYACKRPKDVDDMFHTQLERLETGWIDYYHMHMLSNLESWDRMKALGIERWIEKARSDGKIRNLGFSFHGGRGDFLDLLDAYDWDFCLLQFNYMDKNNQAGAAGVRAANEKGLAVFVMGPVRGGLLTDEMPQGAKQIFSGVDENRSLAEWAFRWVYDFPEVTMALSGMSCISQIEENCATAAEAGPGSLSDAELAAYDRAVSILMQGVRIPCNKCGYCMPCPKGVNIPDCITCYNVSYLFDRISGIAQYTQVTGQWTPLRSDASKCTACGKCEALCPQKIAISKELVRVRRRMLSFLIIPLYRFMRWLWKMK